MFKVGDNIICINDRGYLTDRKHKYFTKNRVYIVTHIDDNWRGGRLWFVGDDGTRNYYMLTRENGEERFAELKEYRKRKLSRIIR